MNGMITKAGLGIALAATALTAAAPAEAQRYRGGYRGYHGYHRGGDVAGAAVLGGILGLGVGAAIASSNRNRYYDRGYYYDSPRVVYRDRYYAPRPYAYRHRYYAPRGYYPGYDRGYYGRGYYGY